MSSGIDFLVPMLQRGNAVLTLQRHETGKRANQQHIEQDYKARLLLMFLHKTWQPVIRQIRIEMEVNYWFPLSLRY
jgi:hypothetical protein